MISMEIAALAGPSGARQAAYRDLSRATGGCGAEAERCAAFAAPSGTAAAHPADALPVEATTLVIGASC